jgi:hypothetical protein
MLWIILAEVLLTVGYIGEAFSRQRQWAYRLLRRPFIRPQRVPRNWLLPDLRREDTRVKRPS